MASFFTLISTQTHTHGTRIVGRRGNVSKHFQTIYGAQLRIVIMMFLMLLKRVFYFISFFTCPGWRHQPGLKGDPFVPVGGSTRDKRPLSLPLARLAVGPGTKATFCPGPKGSRDKWLGIKTYSVVVIKGWIGSRAPFIDHAAGHGASLRARRRRGCCRGRTCTPRPARRANGGRLPMHAHQRGNDDTDQLRRQRWRGENDPIT